MQTRTEKLIIQALKTVNPKDLDFHAQRYEAGDMYQQLVRRARYGDGPHLDVDSLVPEIADACKEDGGGWGNHACLGGHPLKVWKEILYAWGSGDTEDLEKLLGVGSTMSVGA